MTRQLLADGKPIRRSQFRAAKLAGARISAGHGPKGKGGHLLKPRRGSLLPAARAGGAPTQRHPGASGARAMTTPWQRWFAWRPVRLISGGWCWLRQIERRWRDDYGTHFGPEAEYRTSAPR